MEEYEVQLLQCLSEDLPANVFIQYYWSNNNHTSPYRVWSYLLLTWQYKKEGLKYVCILICFILCTRDFYFLLIIKKPLLLFEDKNSVWSANFIYVQLSIENFCVYGMHMKYLFLKFQEFFSASLRLVYTMDGVMFILPTSCICKGGFPRLGVMWAVSIVRHWCFVGH